MSGYFLSVITASVITALTSLLSPDDAKTGKYVRHIAGLITIVIIIEPLTGISDRIKDIDLDFELFENDGTNVPDYRDTIIKETKAAIERDVQAELFTVFRISKDYTAVSVTLDADDYSDVTVSSIVITLKSYGAWADGGEIKRYFEEKYSGAVYVNYE